MDNKQGSYVKCGAYRDRPLYVKGPAPFSSRFMRTDGGKLMKSESRRLPTSDKDE